MPKKYEVVNSPNVSFDVSRDDARLIKLIATRAHMNRELYGLGVESYYPSQDIEMDVTACHANGCPLDLEKCLTFPDHHFAHDLRGIYENINRITGKVTKFLPRCSK